MGLAVFTAVIGVINDILGMASVFKQAEERKRERVAAWLQELGELIKDVADKIELNDYPHNTCAQMEIMVEHFPIIVKGLIDDATIDKLTEQLMACTRVEQLFGELSNMEKRDRDDHIVILLVASGKLQGMSSIVKYDE